MRSAFYRDVIKRCLRDAGINAPTLTANIDPKALLDGLLSTRVEHPRSQATESMPDVFMTDAPPAQIVQGSTPAGDTTPSDKERPTPSDGDQPADTGATLIDGPSSPSPGLERKAIAEKQPILPPTKRPVVTTVAPTADLSTEADTCFKESMKKPAEAGDEENTSTQATKREDQSTPAVPGVEQSNE